MALNRHVFGFMNLSGTDYEYKNYDDSDFSIGRFGLGLGFNVPLGKKLDLVSGVSLQRRCAPSSRISTTPPMSGVTA